MKQKKIKILILIILIFTICNLTFLSNFVLKGNLNETEEISQIEENEYRQNQEKAINEKDLGESQVKENINTQAKEKLEEYISQKRYKVSIGYYDIKTGETIYYKENKLYYGASLIKTLDAIYLYDKSLVNNEIEPYIKKAISKSDNISHEYLVKYIGRDNLKNYGISLGATNTLQIRGNFGNTTVNDQMIYMKKLYSMIETNNNLKSHFINDYGNFMKVDGIKNLHKYGYLNNYFHDVGIFLSDNPYILIILTEHGNDNYKNVIEDISNLIYKYHIKK